MKKEQSEKRICRGIVEILAMQRFQPDVSLCQIVEERRRDLQQRQGGREGCRDILMHLPS